ncbi:hypothetical protein PHYPSEUDO_013309 [Phytophthora pseudosyringae]|uniref:Uncharacterized protein n=1 Tax=Phytophthora pseudosyringae TaxID=221518 RepID=A0A8T1VAB0_9STRA|nr:hypothetical protein PHYPSEUDO_013309 [Phytophthora pseudosyringae]
MGEEAEGDGYGYGEDGDEGEGDGRRMGVDMEEGVHVGYGVLGMCVHASCRIGRLGVAVRGGQWTPRRICTAAWKRARGYGAGRYLHDYL